MRGQFKKGTDDNVWYLIIFGDADILRKFANIWTNDVVQCDKDYMKIKFASNDNLPTDNIINMHQVTIIIRLVFQKGKKLYQQIYLDDCLYKS